MEERQNAHSGGRSPRAKQTETKTSRQALFVFSLGILSAILSLLLLIFTVAGMPNPVYYFGLSFTFPLVLLIGLAIGIKALINIKKADVTLEGTKFVLIGFVLLGGSFASTWIILPDLHVDRGPATRIQCANNLKQIGLSLRIYADNYNGNFAKNLYVLTEKTDLHEDMLQCPNVETFKSIADYKYVAGGHEVNAPEPDPNTIVAFDKKGNHQDYINVLFADGHVEGYKVESIDKVLKGYEELYMPHPDK